jgi:hypothetical protein
MSNRTFLLITMPISLLGAIALMAVVVGPF